jgi:hypothetical protein
LLSPFNHPVQALATTELTMARSESGFLGTIPDLQEIIEKQDYTTARV